MTIELRLQTILWEFEALLVVDDMSEEGRYVQITAISGQEHSPLSSGPTPAEFRVKRDWSVVGDDAKRH